MIGCGLRGQEWDCLVSRRYILTFFLLYIFDYSFIVSKEIVSLHDGTINVFSEGEGRGCCLTVILPYIHIDHFVDAPVRKQNRNEIEPNKFPKSITGHDLVDIISGISSRRNSSNSLDTIDNILPQRRSARHSLIDAYNTISPSSLENCTCVRLEQPLEERLPFADEEFRIPSNLSAQSRNIRKSKSASKVASFVDDTSQKSEIKLSFSTKDLKAIDVKTNCRNFASRNSVLIVDDVVMNRKMLRRLLESRFDTIYEASDGQQAVDMVTAAMGKRNQMLYDVITMDYEMPVMNGALATRLIRNLGYRGHIIAVTANVSPEDINTLLSSGADVVLKKPLDIADFDKIMGLQI